jgi:hypothetical protein
MNRRRRPQIIQVYDKPGAIKLCQTGLVHEPAKQSRKAAKLDLLTLEPGVQSTVGNGGGCIAAIKRVRLVDDGVIARIALGGGLRACDLRSLAPDWIARHHRLPVSEVIFQ